MKKFTPILVITYWSFKDALIQAYTLPYLKQITKISGRKVYLLCLEQQHIRTNKEEQKNVQKELAEFNIEVIFMPYYKFGIKQILLWGIYLCRLLFIILVRNVEYIHCWCTPAGAIGYILKLFSGRKLILDSYEPHAESMVENGTWAKESLAFKILFLLEKKQSQSALYFISIASNMQHYAIKSYGVEIPLKNLFIKPACTDLLKFYPKRKDDTLMKELALQDKIVCIYAGKLGGIYLTAELFDFVQKCYFFWGDKFKFLMLTSASKEEVINQLQRTQIPSHVVVQKFVWHNEIPKYMALADFAINPVKPVSTKRYSSPIKDGEYWAMGLPVVITKNISDDSSIIEENNIGYVLKDLNSIEYQNAIEKIETLLKQDRVILQTKIRKIAEKYRSFKIAENVYQQIYGRNFN